VSLEQEWGNVILEQKWAQCVIDAEGGEGSVRFKQESGECEIKAGVG
jgi:hypothetical protein